MLQGISKMVSARAFKTFGHCVHHTWKDISRDFGALGMKESYFLRKKILRKCCGVSQKQWMLELQTFAIVFNTSENLLVGISGALGMKESHFLCKNLFWEIVVGYLRHSEC